MNIQDTEFMLWQTFLQCLCHETVLNDEMMNSRWKNNQKDFEYAADITIKDTCNEIIKILDSIFDIFL